MPLTRAEVEHIAHLARLRLTPDEIVQYTSELTVILDYFEALRGIDTAGVTPRDQFIAAENVFRDDSVEPSLSRDQALDNAPDQDGEYFHVPKVIG